MRNRAVVPPRRLGATNEKKLSSMELTEEYAGWRLISTFLISLHSATEQPQLSAEMLLPEVLRSFFPLSILGVGGVGGASAQPPKSVCRIILFTHKRVQ